MQTLILFGSPKQKGQTADLLGLAQGYGLGEVTLVDCFHASLSPCVDCGHCKTHPSCVLRDDMQPIYRALETCDRVIVCSPVYFSELVGSIHVALSRLQVYYYQKRFQDLPPKKGLLLLTGGGNGAATPARESGRRYLKLLGAKDIQEVCSLETDTCPVKQDERAKLQMEQVMQWYHRE